MATRSGGISGVIFALVAFVFLFVLTGALTVLFYTQKTQAQEQYAQLNSLSGQLISETERNGADFNRIEQQRQGEGRTIFGQLLINNQNLKRRLTGDGSIGMTQLDSELGNAGIPQGSNALAEVRSMRADLQSARQEVESLREGNEQRAARLAELRQQFTQQQAAHEQTIAQLQEKINELQQSFEGSESAARAEREQLRQTYEDYKAQARDDMREKETEIRTLKNEIAKRDARINDLMQIINAHRLSAPDMTLEPDGRIVDVASNGDVCYINLGKDDNLVLGMTFEVFDQNTGVRTEQTNNAQTRHIGGKATIEVIRFAEGGHTATCRVVRQSYGSPLVIGDLISNIVYDKNRVFRFFVAGQFDLNNDGQSTAVERQRVTNLIEQWGGVVIDAETMPVDTDFLIIGQQMEYPTEPPDDPPPSPVQIQQWLEAKERYTRQLELIGLARELSIPILNQNRFLTLIGYYQ